MHKFPSSAIAAGRYAQWRCAQMLIAVRTPDSPRSVAQFQHNVTTDATPSRQWRHREWPVASREIDHTIFGQSIEFLIVLVMDTSLFQVRKQFCVVSKNVKIKM